MEKVYKKMTRQDMIYLLNNRTTPISELAEKIGNKQINVYIFLREMVLMYHHFAQAETS